MKIRLLICLGILWMGAGHSWSQSPIPTDLRQTSGHRYSSCPPSPCPPGCPPGTIIYPGTVPGTMPGTPSGTIVPPDGGTTVPPGGSSQPGTTPITTPSTDSGVSASDFGFGETGSTIGSGRTESATSYVDSAVVRNQFRFRFDSMYDFRLPDRGEFFYPKCGCFRTAGLDPNAKGPLLPEPNIDSTQAYRSYLEYALTPNFSGFFEVPIIAINPQANANESGFGDINLGLKYAFVNTPTRMMTFQFRTYVPTGDGGRGLGVEHVSLEPAFLFLQQLSDRLLLEGELRDWISVGGTNFAGNVLRYGVGLSYLALNSPSFRVRPVVELVGWTFLDGMFFTPPATIADADGDTIINAKVGLRFGFGELGSQGFLSQSDFAISYGRAITNDELYENIIRVEMRVRY